MFVTSSVAKAMPTETLTYGDTVISRSIDPRTPKDVETAVADYFADIPELVSVARCESQFRHTLKDGSVLRGIVDPRDIGVMQINTYYHGETAEKLGLDLSNFADNMAYARVLYEKQGLKPWSASKPCWGKTIAMR